MLKTIIFTIFGYMSGGLLFARYFSDLFCGRDVTADTP
ncbi:MAG TPA: acyl-phosphate glycerol 3-phosphate acyltransferase, partial [Ruminococcaceae bacterium]|nr:acyl-phosphate glycerol 3-phosphate acyltransferase [Oscillospiraceae bacterium]